MYSSYKGKQNPQTADPKIITSKATAGQEKDIALSTLAQKLGSLHETPQGQGPKDTTTFRMCSFLKN